MTYVDDDDFDELEAKDNMDDDLETDESRRCDECGIKVKKDDAIVCPACTATYHRWCVTECIRCNTQLNVGEGEDGKLVKGAGKRAAPKKKTAVKAASTVKVPRAPSRAR